MMMAMAMKSTPKAVDLKEEARMPTPNFFTTENMTTVAAMAAKAEMKATA